MPFTVRGLVLAVAGAALVFAIFVTCLRWLRYPHVTVTIFNETSTAICDVRIRFAFGERTAEWIKPGGFAVTEIQSAGDSGVFFSFRDSGGILRKDEPLYYSDERGAPDRGVLEVHVTNDGKRVVKRIYTAILFDIPVWRIPVRPRGRMTVK